MKKFLFFLLLFVVVVLSGCLSQNKVIVEESVATEVSPCEERTVGNWCYTALLGESGTTEGCAETYEGCLASRVYDSLDSKDCDLIQDESLKDSCYMNLASSSKDESYCTLVTDRMACTDGVYYARATINCDALSCEKISILTQKDACYSNVGTFCKDVTSCEKISDAAMKSNCLAFV